MERDGWTPGKLFGVSEGYWRSCALHAAVKLELFTRLGNAGRTADEVAVELPGADARGAGALLNAMAAMGLLRKERGQFHNTGFSRTHLVKGSPQYLGGIILHYRDMVQTWAVLDRAIAEGKPVGRPPQHTREEQESFLTGMLSRAMAVAPELAARVDLEGRTRLLDLGGGPGTYAIHFCLRNPDLRATVYDLPVTLPFATRTIERFGLSDRIRYVPGNYLKEDIPGSFDVVWLSHILHAFGPEACREILGRAVSALRPRGLLMVHDFILDDTLDGPLFPALFSLNMLLHTDQGRAYSDGQIADMLEHAGLRNVRRLPFRGHNDSGIIAGER